MRPEKHEHGVLGGDKIKPTTYSGTLTG